MKNIKYFFQFIIIIIFFFFFKILGPNISSAISGKIFELVGPLFRSKKLIHSNIRKAFPDIDYNSLNAGDFIVIDCHRILDPTTYTQLFNDSFMKRYLTSLIKRQWGQNLIKFQGVKLPGGIELNGREIYDDALRELQMIKEEMSSTYELPPLDFIG